eukprot:11178309-Lingulodinium_polyedra.AAC.1
MPSFCAAMRSSAMAMPIAVAPRCSIAPGQQGTQCRQPDVSIFFLQRPRARAARVVLRIMLPARVDPCDPAAGLAVGDEA